MVEHCLFILIDVKAKVVYKNDAEILSSNFASTQKIYTNFIHIYT